MIRRLTLTALAVAVGYLFIDHPRVRAARRAVANTNVGHIRPVRNAARSAGT